jgi:hypothetical protein
MNVPAAVDRIIGGEALFGENEEEVAAIGYLLLKKCAENPGTVDLADIGLHYTRSAEANDNLDVARQIFLEPFYDYLDEHIDDQQAILYFLRRYKHRCEWFRAERLRKLIEEDTQNGERRLASDLYEYLHEQGIDFHIEPQSASGWPDLVAEQVGEDRVVAEAKVYWPDKGKTKAYILSGFHQVCTYARDYNEPCGYLVIYKMSNDELRFLVPANSAAFPSLSLNNKTIFFIVVDVVAHGAAASKSGSLKTVDITEAELIQSAEERVPPPAEPAPAPDATRRN